MRLVLQRVKSTKVEVVAQVIPDIDQGILAFFELVDDEVELLTQLP